MKKFLHNLLAAFIVISVFTGVHPVQAQAAVKMTIPSKIRCDVGMEYMGGISSQLEKGDTIKNVKSSSSNFLAVANTRSGGDDTESYMYLYFYAKKEGIYTLKWDVYKSNGEKRRSYSVKIYAQRGFWANSVIDSITVDGKKVKIKTGEFNNNLIAKEERCGTDIDLEGYNYGYGTGYFFETSKKDTVIKFTLKKDLRISRISYADSSDLISEAIKYTNFKNGTKIKVGSSCLVFRIEFRDSFDGKNHTSYCWLNYKYDPSRTVEDFTVSVNGKKIAARTLSYFMHGGTAFTSKKSGKVKFTLTGDLAGAEITDIQVTTYDKKGRVNSRTFKNGANLVFSKGWYKEDNDRTPYAETEFNISYKINDQNGSLMFSLYSPF